jgi:hypothetical protein
MKKLIEQFLNIANSERVAEMVYIAMIVFLVYAVLAFVTDMIYDAVRADIRPRPER